MGTSGTTAFNLDIDDIIQEGYQRCSIRTNSGYDLKSARRSLDLLFAEWGNRGIHLWKVELDENALVSGQAEYTVSADVNDVLEAFISSSSIASESSSTQDVSLTKIDRSAYAALPNKLTTGSPSQYYVERLTTPKIYLYQAPDLNTYTHLKYYVIKRIEDSGAYTDQADVAYRFFLLHLHNFEKGGVLDQFDFDWELKHYLEVGLKEPPEFPLDRDRKDYVNV